MIPRFGLPRLPLSDMQRRILFFLIRASFVCFLIFESALSSAQTVPQQRPKQQSKPDSCHECPPPGGIARGGYMDVALRNSAPLQNAVSIKRSTVHLFDRDVQALHVWYERNGKYFDTLIPISDANQVSYSGIGEGQQTVKVPVYPAREFYRNSGNLTANGDFLTISPFVGYAGSDSSRRKIGFSSFYYGLELLVSPFGNTFGERISLLLSGAALFEGSRFRIPLGGNIRWTFLGSQHIESRAAYIPGPCKFSQAGDSSFVPTPDGFVEVTSDQKTDPNVYYAHERIVVHDAFRPFLYVEGGAILNGKFDGAGRDPSVNPTDYGQYYAGIGLGAPVFDWIEISLGYRYMRLNLRTPCTVCPADFYVQNTNVSHSILLKIGGRINF
jgi:hypothetical protein